MPDPPGWKVWENAPLLPGGGGAWPLLELTDALLSVLSVVSRRSRDILFQKTPTQCVQILDSPAVVPEELGHTLCFFYKNLFYKNVEAEFCLKFKNILRTLPRLRVS